MVANVKLNVTRVFMSMKQLKGLSAKMEGLGMQIQGRNGMADCLVYAYQSALNQKIQKMEDLYVTMKIVIQILEIGRLIISLSVYKLVSDLLVNKIMSIDHIGSNMN